jgi:hypothetical protein
MEAVQLKGCVWAVHMDSLASLSGQLLPEKAARALPVSFQLCFQLAVLPGNTISGSALPEAGYTQKFF